MVSVEAGTSRICGNVLDTFIPLRQGGSVSLGKFPRCGLARPFGDVVKADVRRGIGIGRLYTLSPCRIISAAAPLMGKMFRGLVVGVNLQEDAHVQFADRAGI